MRRDLATNSDKQIFNFGREEHYLALDYHRKRVYAFKTMERANVIMIEMDYEGRKRNHIIKYGFSGQAGIIAADVFGSFLYWKQDSSPIIFKMNVSSRDISRYIPFLKGNILTKFLVVDENRQSKGKFL